MTPEAGLNVAVEAAARALCRKRIERNRAIDRREIDPAFMKRAEDFAWSDYVEDARAALDAAAPYHNLKSAVAEFLDAEDAVEKEAARAEANGGLGWSSAPTVRRVYAVKLLRDLLAEVTSPALTSNEP